MAERSRGRIEADPEFIEIREKLAEVEEDGIVHIEELLKEREETREKEEGESNGKDGEESDERENSPQLQEAIRVLTDLVVLQRRNRQEIAAAPHAS